MKKFFIVFTLIIAVFLTSNVTVNAGPGFELEPDPGGGGGGPTEPEPDPEPDLEPDPEPEPLPSPLQNGSIDLNSDSFGTQEYAVAEWKYDFIQMFENYENSWDINDSGIDFNYVFYYSRMRLLEEKVLPRVGWNDFFTNEYREYYFYKSQVIPHNEYVYDELLVVLETYKLITEIMVEDYEELSDMYFDTFITKFLSPLPNGYDDYIRLIIEAASEYDPDDKPSLNIACQAMTVAPELDDPYKDYAELSCKAILQNVDDYNEDAIRGYLDDKDPFEIIGPLALDMGIDILNNTAQHVVKNYVPGMNVLMTSGDVLYSLYALSMSDMYSDLSIATNEVLEAIDPAMLMIDAAHENPQFHLRIDYLVGDHANANDPGMFNDYNYQSPYTIEEAAENMENTFDASYTKGLFFQLVSDDTLTEDWLPHCMLHGHSVTGNLSVYSADDFVTEFTDLIYEQTNLVPIYPHMTYYANSAQYLFGD